MTKKNAAVRKGNSADQIYEELRKRILSLELAPGTVIDEAALVREFGKSRTPVREALVRLASIGLIILLPNRGSQVAPLDLSSIRDNLEAIDVLQRAVTIWAALRRKPHHLAVMRERAAAFDKAASAGDSGAMVITNRAFHSAIADACGNAQMAAAYERILDEGLRLARFSLNRLDDGAAPERRKFVKVIADEHDEMIDAIERQDAEKAEALATSHTEVTRQRFSSFLGETMAPRVKLKRATR